jgi:hypothetical protein
MHRNATFKTGRQLRAHCRNIFSRHFQQVSTGRCIHSVLRTQLFSAPAQWRWFSRFLEYEAQQVQVAGVRTGGSRAGKAGVELER